MPVEVRLPTVLRQYADGATAVGAEGTTVGEVLTDLSARYPGIAEQLAVGASTDIPRFVNVYLNDEDIRYLDRLETKVGEADVISIMPAVSGGR
ncbi:MAG: MoaD/ThiS family protein [Acidimicrobiia bacterium]|nr:MoaD/ThiS family protein [Acidimicrobiia bacterium]